MELRPPQKRRACAGDFLGGEIVRGGWILRNPAILRWTGRKAGRIFGQQFGKKERTLAHGPIRARFFVVFPEVWAPLGPLGF